MTYIVDNQMYKRKINELLCTNTKVKRLDVCEIVDLQNRKDKRKMDLY